MNKVYKDSEIYYSGLFYDNDNKLVTGVIMGCCKIYYLKDGKYHNENGPAVIYVDCDSTAHYLDGNIIGANLTDKTFEKLKNRYYKELVFK